MKNLCCPLNISRSNKYHMKLKNKVVKQCKFKWRQSNRRLHDLTFTQDTLDTLVLTRKYFYFYNNKCNMSKNEYMTYKLDDYEDNSSAYP